MRDEIKDQIQGIFRQVFESPDLVVSDEMTANDVTNWTSLTHLIMIEKVEKHFGIKVLLKELMKMKNVGDLINLVEIKKQPK